MINIPPQILHDLGKILLQCEAFNSNSELKAIFVDSRLSAWRNELPETITPSKRVAAVVEFLMDKYNNLGQNALFLLLHVLSEHILPNDARHLKLRELANAIEPLLIQESSSTSEPLQRNLGFQDFIKLLEAMGYRILDKGKLSERNMILQCQVKLGMEVRQSLISVALDIPRLSDVDTLRACLLRLSDYNAILVSQFAFPTDVKTLAKQEGIQVYSYDDLLLNIIDFTQYLNNLIAEHEDSEVNKYYVDLHCTTPNGTSLEISQYMNDWLKNPRDKHISILGTFGTGKTWFCQHFVVDQAKKCLENPHERIPILITLREYSKAYDIVQVITDLCANRLKIALPAGYATFDFLNEAGRLVLVFDGLDEMERRISDYQAITDNFWELAKVSAPEKSKVMLTCRSTYFRNNLEENEILTGNGRKINIVSGEKWIEIGGESPYKVIKIMELSIAELKKILEKRIGERSQAMWQTIQESPSLFDLSRRPALVDMLIRVIPEIITQSGKVNINLAKLFTLYIQQSLRRYDFADAPITLEDRLLFLEDLSWGMHMTQQLSISWADFPEKVKKYFKLEQDPEGALFFERSLRTQSYLTRDANGNYSFAHKSLVEFFVAKKLFRLLTEHSIEQNVQSDFTGDFLDIFGCRALTPEITNLLRQLLQEREDIKEVIKNKLFRLIRSTQYSQFEEVKYTGGNAVTLLHALGYSIKGMDWSHAILVAADLRNADLTSTNLHKANLSESILSNTVLNETDLSGAILTGVRLEHMNIINSIDWSPNGDQLVISGEDTHIKIWNIEGADRPAVLVGHQQPVLSVSWSPVGNLIASIDAERNIFLWNTLTREIVRKWQPQDLLLEGMSYQLSHISRQVFFSKSGEYILVGNSRLLVVINVEQDRPAAVLIAGRQNEISVDGFSISWEKWRGEMDWVVRYESGIELSRIQHKNIAFERRSGIVSGFNNSADSISQTTLGTVTDYVDREFSSTYIAKKLIFPDVTTIVYNSSRKKLACGVKSEVIIWRITEIDAYESKRLDLRLSCDKLKIENAIGLPPTVLKVMESKGVKLDGEQKNQLRDARIENAIKIRHYGTRSLGLIYEGDQE